MAILICPSIRWSLRWYNGRSRKSDFKVRKGLFDIIPSMIGFDDLFDSSIFLTASNGVPAKCVISLIMTFCFLNHHFLSMGTIFFGEGLDVKMMIHRVLRLGQLPDPLLDFVIVFQTARLGKACI